MRYYVRHHAAGPIFFRRSDQDVFARLDGSTWSPVEVDVEAFDLDPTVEELPEEPTGYSGVRRELDGPEPLPYPFSQPTPGRSVRL